MSDTLTTRSRHGLNLWGAELTLDGRKFVIDQAERTEIEGEFILQRWSLREITEHKEELHEIQNVHK